MPQNVHYDLDALDLKTVVAFSQRMCFYFKNYLITLNFREKFESSFEDLASIFYKIFIYYHLKMGEIGRANFNNIF